MLFKDKSDDDGYYLPNGTKVIDKPQLKYIAYCIEGFEDQTAADLYMDILYDSHLKNILNPHRYEYLTSDKKTTLRITGWYTDSILSDIVEFTRMFKGLSVSIE